MSDLALPPHLRGRLHNDWAIWPFNKISRGWNAAGPRPPKDAKDYMAWPPKLVEGRGISRWETAGGDSIIHIPALDNCQITGAKFYGRNWLCVEMNPGKPDFMKSRDIFFPAWQEAHVYDTPDPDRPGKFIQHCAPDNYSPSALQKFSKQGYMELEPDYKSWWKVLKKRELPVWPETGDDRVMFYRAGNRPDHVDCYYNCDKIIPIGFVGLKWE